ATGNFSWPVSVSQAAGDYPITVRVTDNGSPPKSDAKTFTVHVVPLDLVISSAVTLSQSETHRNVTLQGGGILTVDAPLTVTGDMVIQSGGAVTHSERLLAGLVLSVAGTLDVQSGGAVDASARGLRGGNNGSIFAQRGEVFDTTGAIV